MSRIYDTQRWKRVRANQLAREPLCRMCKLEGRSIPRAAQHVDHIQTIRSGGAPYDRNNLQSLCHQHHSEKTGLDKLGIDFNEWMMRGCNPDGTPRDPSHPWFEGNELNG